MKQNLDFLTPAIPDLEKFSEFLLKWQRSVNLISPATIPHLWDRHILDSIQLYPLIPNTAKTLVDIGSGAGLPGLVLAIVNKALNGPLTEITLIESDIKKCVFIQEAIRTLGLQVHVKIERVEKMRIPDVDVLTARALADVEKLLMWSRGLITPKTTCLFLKGSTVDQEIQTLSATDRSVFTFTKIPSQIDPKGCVLKINMKNKA